MQAAADSYLEAVYEFGRQRKACGGCWDAPAVLEAQRIMNERDAVYQSLREPARVAVEALNAALEEWDRVRDISLVNTP